MFGSISVLLVQKKSLNQLLLMARLEAVTHDAHSVFIKE